MGVDLCCVLPPPPRSSSESPHDSEAEPEEEEDEDEDEDDEEGSVPRKPGTCKPVDNWTQCWSVIEAKVRCG